MPKALLWTDEMDAILGQDKDPTIAARLGVTSLNVYHRRKKLGIPAYYSAAKVACASCGKAITKDRNRLQRAKRPTCSRACADDVRRTRDSDVLRYGPGWGKLREQIRRRDRVCRVCGKTPEENGRPLAAHHLKPYRLGGRNDPANLIAVCLTCHPALDRKTTDAIESLPLAVTFEGATLRIALGEVVLYEGGAK